MKPAVSSEEIEKTLEDCLDQLLTNDLVLLINDVSERAITHKLAEYLQARIPHLNVDCEYNRNLELGEHAQKLLHIVSENRVKKIQEGLEEDDLLAISTYPDIIVHRRGTNADNLLVVEVKKRSSRVSADFDWQKLSAFTENSDHNRYHYRLGAFVLLDTGTEKPERPDLIWFSEGKRSAPI